MRTFLLLLLVACNRAEPVDACDVDSAACLACASDDECAWGGNPCTDTVYCAHVDASVSVVQIGCSEALERRWPAPEDCACDDVCGGR